MNTTKLSLPSCILRKMGNGLCALIQLGMANTLMPH